MKTALSILLFFLLSGCSPMKSCLTTVFWNKKVDGLSSIPDLNNNPVLEIQDSSYNLTQFTFLKARSRHNHSTLSNTGPEFSEELKGFIQDSVNVGYSMHIYQVILEDSLGKPCSANSIALKVPYKNQVDSNNLPISNVRCYISGSDSGEWKVKKSKFPTALQLTDTNYQVSSCVLNFPIGPWTTSRQIGAVFSDANRKYMAHLETGDYLLIQDIVIIDSLGNQFQAAPIVLKIK
ncbi:hypothetical protein KFE98_06570 [bacterium SCSIO 12741]|nr:hypothetical protein KFE98_06570 [bacterium SCSIO 12741]